MIDPYSKEFRRKHRQTDFTDKGLERKFVAGIVKKRVVMEKVYLNFDSNVLSSDNIKWIYDKAVEMYLHESVLMDDEAFEHTLDVDEKKRKRLKIEWKKIKKKKKRTSEASTLAAMQKLKSLYDARNMSLCVEDTITHLSKAVNGDMNSVAVARENLKFYSEHTGVKDVKMDAGDPRESYEAFKRRFKKIQKHPDLIGGVPTGIKEIDRQMIGIRPGEFGLLAGPTGSGKSVWLLDILTWCWRSTGSVVAVTIEMPKEQYEMRWYCNMSGIDYEKFRKYELTKKQWNHLDRVVEKAKSNKNRFEIIDLPEGCTPQVVATEVKPLVDRYDIQEIGVDYLNIMANKKGEIDLTWEAQVSNAVQLKQLVARGLGVATWTLGQTNGQDDLAFAKHIKDQLDVGLLLCPDEDTDETGIMPIKWIKTRDFRGKSFTVQTTMNKMRFRPISKRNKKKYRKVNKGKKRSIKL